VQRTQEEPVLTIVARITVNEAAVPRFVAALAPLVEATLAEEGCHLYEFNQSNDDPCVFVVYEKWADQAALDLHMQTPHLQGLVAAFGAEFSAAPVIEPFTRVA
jgi:quinol monooxygenase YgiN